MQEQLPLCVDLDGTLLKTNTLYEALLLSLKRSPSTALQLPIWLLRGKAHFKQELSKHVLPVVGSLPCNSDLLNYLRLEKEKGRSLILTTGANQSAANAFAEKLGLFDEVLASDSTHNLSGRHKAEALQNKFGNGRFDYAGNAYVDLDVWSVARSGIIVSNDERLIQDVKRRCQLEKIFRPERPGFKVWLRALRIHQWSKNFLVFIPLICAHRWYDIERLKHSVMAFLSFSLCAASVYVLNDLVDLESDRHHPRKCKRPFANGDLSIPVGIASVPILLVVSIAFALSLSLPFFLVFAGYYVATVFYSFHLKRLELFDVFVLAGLYGMRVLAGAFAVSVPISDWLLIFCIFFFLSLAFVKRFVEIHSLQNSDLRVTPGRSYAIGDLNPIASMGLASGYMAVLVLALYVSSPAVAELYMKPRVLWLACPLNLYWISYVWLLAHRGLLHEDPIAFALRDRRSYGVALVFLLIFWFAHPK